MGAPQVDGELGSPLVELEETKMAREEERLRVTFDTKRQRAAVQS